jgi:outer membrane protein insertion porin family
MLKRIFNLLLLLIVLPQTVLLAQTNDSITQSESGDLTVNYTSPPKTYYIADVRVTGVEETMYAGQEFVLINFAGLGSCLNFFRTECWDNTATDQLFKWASIPT